jgi:serine-type D-Ala-D-Ala carboxypeptidase/endopeptidase (penicillin-binding protein 4)
MRSSRTRRASLLLVAIVTLASCGARGPHTAAPAPPPLDPAALLARDLAAELVAPEALAAAWGVRVESLDRPGPALFSHNADQLFVPASNMKLLTVAVAADRLGWDHTFPTAIQATTRIADDGTVRGDLVVQGTGDPTIGNRPTSAGSFAEWAEALWQSGLRRVNGRIVGDDRAFANEPLGQGWAWDDVPYGYSAPESALIYNENTAAIEIAPGPAPGTFATARLVDVAAGLSLQSYVTTGSAGSPTSIDLARLPGSSRLRLTGTIASDAAPVIHYAAVDNPPRYFAAALREALIARGIVVIGPASDVETSPPGPLPDGAPVLLTRQSPPLSAIAARLLKVSQNLYAETLLREAVVSPATPPTAAAGAAVVRDTLLSWGLPAGSFTQSDGSGLSRYNLVSPTAFVRVLSHAFHDPRLKDAWIEALPVTGVDGTLERRMKGTSADGHVHAKTGSLSGVRSLSGYVETDDGEWLVFSILANNFAVPVADVDAVTDRIVERLVAFRR